ncbi:membrane protein insertase YidC [bacterium]|nr:MAG: membrane protein insertase YidC [bacterium]
MDRRTIIGMILIAVIIIAWPFYTKLISPEPVPVKYNKEGAAVKIDTAKSIYEKRDSVIAKKVNADETQKTRTDIPIKENALWSNAPEKVISIKSKLYTTKISNKSGGTIREWILQNYNDGNGNKVSFVDSQKNINFSFNYHNQVINLSDAVFETSSNQSEIDLDYVGNWSISYTLVFDQTRAIVQTFTFYKDRYDFDVDVEFKNFGDEVINSEYQLQWLSGLHSTEKDLHGDLTYFKAYSLLGDEKEEFDVSENSSELAFSGLTKWLASRTKYFVLFIIPQEKDGTGCKLRGEAFTKNGALDKKEYLLSMSMKFESNKKDRFKIYIGPMDFSTLNKYDENLTVIMEWGWAIIRPITKAILYTFNFLYGIIPNYGWVIIVFALLVRIVLYPLTHKSFVGMQKMKEVMPKQKEIQKKFKDNPTKMQQEMMKLYKEVGYNPLSGCLIMFIQLPILFPIYQVFNESLDLRQAPFFGWIKDLSIPDTVAILHTGLPFIGDFHVNPLPIIMTVLTFVQQKIAPMTPMDNSDPSQKFNQKFLLYGMPIMFFFLFNNFASGLVLYWTMFNVLTMAQQLLMAKHVIK